MAVWFWHCCRHPHGCVLGCLLFRRPRACEATKLSAATIVLAFERASKASRRRRKHYGRVSGDQPRTARHGAALAQNATTAVAGPKSTYNPHYPDPAWLALRQEEIIEPQVEIVDPHHHLWDRPGNRFLLDQLLVDVRSGHKITKTVFIECGSMYRANGPTEMKPVGETEFVNGTAAMSASGQYGPMRLCRGIVGHADLRLGDSVARVLEAQITAGDGRFRGIRHSVAWDASDAFPKARTNPVKGQMFDPIWRAGFARLKSSSRSPRRQATALGYSACQRSGRRRAAERAWGSPLLRIRERDEFNSRPPFLDSRPKGRCPQMISQPHGLSPN